MKVARFTLSESSEKNYEEDTEVTGFGLATVKNQGAAVSYDSETQGPTKRYTHVTYGLGYIVTREELEDNLYEVVSKRRIKALSFSVRQTEETVAANIMNRAFNSSYTGADGKEMCATDHPTADGTQSPAVPWTRDIGLGQVAGRKSYWCNALPAVVGETPTPFQRAVVSAESTSLMGNWGTEGIALINCDLTVALARLPRSLRVGVDSDFHIEDAGVSVSETILYDAEGPIGTAICTAVNNAQSEIDFTVVKPSDRLRQV